MKVMEHLYPMNLYCGAYKSRPKGMFSYVHKSLHRNLDQIFILYSLPNPTFDDHHRSNKQYKASAAHLLCFINMERGSDNGNPFGHHPEPPIGIIIHIPNIPSKKLSRKRTTSCRQPCQHPSFA